MFDLFMVVVTPLCSPQHNQFLTVRSSRTSFGAFNRGREGLCQVRVPC